jgi:cell division protein ZapA
MSDDQPITISILDNEYRIACPAGEQDALRQSAMLLNQRIHEVRNKGKVISPERAAVMAALNIIHEFHSELRDRDQQSERLDNTLRNLHERIEEAIHSAKQLEL